VRLLSQSEWLAEVERSMMRHILLIIASVHRSKYTLEREIELHRAMCTLCTERRVDEALAWLREGFVESKAFAIRFTFEALKIARIKAENS
jgi:hypothetical protein